MSDSIQPPPVIYLTDEFQEAFDNHGYSAVSIEPTFTCKHEYHLATPDLNKIKQEAAAEFVKNMRNWMDAWERNGTHSFRVGVLYSTMDRLLGEVGK